jgi:hypothetical protein
MSHHPKGQHWRDLGKSKSLDLPDESTGAILRVLNGKAAHAAFLQAQQARHPVTAHEGVASVGADGIKPRAHDCADCGPAETANAEFNEATKPKRETTRPDQLVAAGITGPAKFGR